MLWWWHLLCWLLAAESYLSSLHRGLGSSSPNVAWEGQWIMLNCCWPCFFEIPLSGPGFILSWIDPGWYWGTESENEKLASWRKGLQHEWVPPQSVSDSIWGKWTGLGSSILIFFSLSCMESVVKTLSAPPPFVFSFKTMNHAGLKLGWPWTPSWSCCPSLPRHVSLGLLFLLFHL